MGRRGMAIIVAVALVVGLGFGGYRLFTKVRTALLGEGCSVTARSGDIELEVDQASNAATIAAVAHHRRLPRRALVIAYATAEQESHIENLSYGDRDSVGIFQQRPSQGWGTTEQLQDPVYASGRFFDALVKVKDYTKRDLHDAAQLVQRSADGSLYAQHEPMAEILTTGFTGQSPAAVTCWYAEPAKPRRPDTTGAFSELRRAFGPEFTVRKNDADIVLPPGSSPATGWSVASWAVTHAKARGFHEVRYAGRRWTPEEGHDGWTKDKSAPTSRILLR